MQVTKRQWMYYGITTVSIIAYTSLSFLAPTNPQSNTFGFTPMQILILKLTIIVPYFLTWALAAYGISTLEKYIRLKKEKDDIVSPLLKSFRTGLLWIVTGTILTAIIGGLMPFFMTNEAVKKIFTITTNYLLVFPSLIGFLIIFRGTMQLQSSKEMHERKRVSYIFNTIVVLVISIIYIYLLYTNPTRQFSSDPTIPPTYYLPDIVIGLTLVFPIIVTWWLGFFTSFTLSNLIPYLTRVEFFKGITQILYGMWSIIFTSILIQALLSLGASRLYAIGIGILLLIIYVFLFLQGLGYLFIALGSNALQKSVIGNTKS